MSDKPQIFLLGPKVPGLEGALDRLEDVGYEWTPFDTLAKDRKGVAVMPIGRETDFALSEEEFRKKRAQFPSLEWIAVYSGRLKVKLHYLHGLGFNSIFQIPLDEELFTNRIFEIEPLLIPQKELRFDHLLRVNLPLLRELEVAPFDVFIYLPSNRRIMLYFREGHPVEKAQLEKFEKHRNYSLFIRKSDIAKYKTFTSDSLLKIKLADSMSDDEKIANVQENVQILMGPFFEEGELSDEEGRQTIRQLQESLRGLQIRPNLERETLESLEKLASQKMTNASHSNNVAAYCALFGIALGMKNIDELRLGGLLHDVGLADMPMELLGRDEKKMSAEDRARYHLHPGNGKTDVINRKVPVTETVLNMILLHHERPDGSGYPYGKKKEEIPVEAQICAFADEFDKLTSLREGYSCYSAKDALLLMAGELGDPPAAVYNPEIHRPILEFYLKSPAPNASAASPASSADGVASGHGQVILRARPGTVERKKFQDPILLNDLRAQLPPLPAGKVPIDADILPEVEALEKETEFYFFEKKS